MDRRWPWGGVLSSGNSLLCARRLLCSGPLSLFWDPGQASHPPQLVGASLRSPSWSPPTRARPQVLPLPRAFPTIDLGAGRVLDRTQGGCLIQGPLGKMGTKVRVEAGQSRGPQPGDGTETAGLS